MKRHELLSSMLGSLHTYHALPGKSHRCPYCCRGYGCLYQQSCCCL